MTRKSIKGLFAKSMSKKADPIEENKNLPSMDDADTIKAKSATAKKTGAQAGKAKTTGAAKATASLLMDNVKDPVVTKTLITAGKAMAAFDTANKDLRDQKNLPEQSGRTVRAAAGRSYVVFRMQVQNGKLAVVGSRKVNAELVQNEDVVQNGLTYEARLNDKRISIGSVADFGEQRSFARPTGESGHHINILPSFEFNVKIPSDEIVVKDLPKIQITLSKFKEHVRDLKLNAQPLQAQFEKEVREVAVLNGIKISGLSKDVKEMVKKSVRK